MQQAGASITLLDSRPAVKDFTPLAIHQSSTPDSFFRAKPVLYFHSKSCHIIFSGDSSLSPLTSLVGNFQSSWCHTACHALDQTDGLKRCIVAAEVFVTDRSIIIACHKKFDSRNANTETTGQDFAVSISYPLINLHAITSISLCVTGFPVTDPKPQAGTLSTAPSKDDSSPTQEKPALYLLVDPLHDLGCLDTEAEISDDAQSDTLGIYILPENEPNLTEGSDFPLEEHAGNQITPLPDFARPEDPLSALYNAVSRCTNLMSS